MQKSNRAATVFVSLILGASLFMPGVSAYAEASDVEDAPVEVNALAGDAENPSEEEGGSGTLEGDGRLPEEGDVPPVDGVEEDEEEVQPQDDEDPENPSEDGEGELDDGIPASADGDGQGGDQGAGGTGGDGTGGDGTGGDPQDPVDPGDDPEDPVIPEGPNYDAAKEEYGVTDEHALEATTVEELKTALSEAGSLATDEVLYIVHAPAGDYELTQILTVPSNVILVAEDAALFVSANEGKSMINVSGVLYGGSYDGAGIATPGIRINPISFTGVNGTVEKASIKNVGNHGVYAAGPDCKSGRIIDCTITNCGRNGILVNQDASIDEIRGCIIRDNGFGGPDTYSGISIVHSNVYYIIGCTITGNADKGISTSSGDSPEYLQMGSNIDTITECNISDNLTNGVYMKPMCHVNHFTNNTLSGNPDGIICCSSAYDFTGASYVRDVRNNTFSNNTNSQLHAYAPGASIAVGANNTFTGGNNTIVARDSGLVKFVGDGNIIQNSKGAGVDANGGKVQIIGNGTIIRNNGTFGIYAKKGSVSITGPNTQIYGNKTNGISLYEKSALSISGASAIIKANKSNNVYVTGASQFSVSGKGAIIHGATQHGIYANGGTVTISGQGTQITSNVKNNIYLVGSSKLTISGKGTIIQGAGMQGLYVSKSTVLISGASTQIKKSKANNVYMVDGGKVTIKGAGTIIASAAQHGFYMKHSTLVFSGANSEIKANTKSGISALEKSKVTLSGTGTRLMSNKAQGIIARNSAVAVSGSSTRITSNGSSGIGAYDSSVVSVTGTSCAILNNKQYGVYAANKAKVSLKKVTITGNTKGATYKTSGATITKS